MRPEAPDAAALRPLTAATASAVAAAMTEADRVFARLGMRLESAAPGQATVSMEVREEMLNGHDICHGGVVFTLADTAFAVACNSANVVTLAQAAEITFLAAAERGERLSATAEERARPGRTGVWDVTVTGRDGRMVALFRGHSYRIGGKIVEEMDIVEGD